MGYALPTPTGYVSCSWQCHKNRNPPSSEPGTDYGCGYGSAVYAPGNGKVVDRSTSPSGGTGRYVTIDLDDGRRTRTLHLASVQVSVGQRVTRGQRIATSGASGYGDDWYYGPHAHQTLWAGHYYSFCPTCTIDFAKYVGSDPTPPTPTPTPPPEALIMATEVIVTVKDANGNAVPDNKRRTAFVNTESGFNCDFSWMTVADADKWAKALGMPSALQFSDTGFDKFISRLNGVKPAS